MRLIFYNRIMFYFLFLLSVLSFLSCKEIIFNPKEEYSKKYIFYFILRGDTTYQAAKLTSTYDVDGFNPMDNETDPSVKNADIKIWYDNRVYTMYQDSLKRNDTSRYKTPVYIYTLNDFKIDPGKNVEVQVEMQNGKKLTAQTTVPPEIALDSIDIILPPLEKNYASFAWHLPDNNDGIYFSEKMRLYYKVKTDTGTVNKSIQIPVDIVNSIPVYPSVSRKNYLMVPNYVLDSVMKRISYGDPIKKNYTIVSADLEIIVMDRVYSAYYSSTHGYLDSYSIRVDEIDFTNINGGYGIFASYLKKRYSILIRQSYVESFGYKYGY